MIEKKIGKIIRIFIDAAENENDAIDGIIEIDFSGKLYQAEIIFLGDNIPKIYSRNRKAIESLIGKKVEFEFEFLDYPETIKEVSEKKENFEIIVPNLVSNTTVNGRVIAINDSIIKIDAGVSEFSINRGNLINLKIGDFVQATGILRIKIKKILEKEKMKHKTVTGGIGQ